MMPFNGIRKRGREFFGRFYASFLSKIEQASKTKQKKTTQHSKESLRRDGELDERGEEMQTK